MKTQNVIVLAVGILVLAAGGGFFTGRLSAPHPAGNGEDSPITVADGSINLHWDRKFKHQSDKDHSAEDKEGSFAESVECLSCSQRAKTSLSHIDNWNLMLNDGTVIKQDPQADYRVRIHLNTPAVRAEDHDIVLGQPNQEPHLKGDITLAYGDTPVQTFTCPASGCQIVIHYRIPN